MWCATTTDGAGFSTEIGDDIPDSHGRTCGHVEESFHFRFDNLIHDGFLCETRLRGSRVNCLRANDFVFSNFFDFNPGLHSLAGLAVVLDVRLNCESEFDSTDFCLEIVRTGGA